MILISKEKHNAVFTLDSETNGIYYAPIQDDNTVNLSDFEPIDMFDYTVTEYDELLKELMIATQSQV